MKTSDFDYDLPPELIAQEPAAERDGCRLLVMNRVTGEVEDRVFRDIVDYLTPNDLLVANETRVMPARLLGAKRGTGGAAEVFLLRQHGTPTENRSALWEVLVRPGKRLKPGTGAVVDFTDAEGNVALSAEIVDWLPDAQKGERLARLTTPLPSLDEALHAVGHTPATRSSTRRCTRVARARRRRPRRACTSRPSSSSTCASRAFAGRPWSWRWAWTPSASWTRTIPRSTSSTPSSTRCPKPRWTP